MASYHSHYYTPHMRLEEKASQFPTTPGVYLMKDESGRVLYVGKAVNLRKRISNYFGKKREGRYQIASLMKKVRDIDCVVTENEKEALLLENTLIKKNRPRYNIQLRDDKSYLSLKLSIKDRFPRLYVTRQIRKDGSRYFGPYSSAVACRETVDFIETHFRLRTCSDQELINRTRPCLQYQIHRCDAPCVGLIPEADYKKIAEKVRLFLEGRNSDLLDQVEREMSGLAEREEFEKAARARDLASAIRKTLERQNVARHRWIDQDAIGLYREGEKATFCVLLIREGKIWGSRCYHSASCEEDPVTLEGFLSQFYGENRFIPDEVIVPLGLPNLNLLTDLLTERRGKKTVLRVARRGDRADLLELATKNATEGFRQRSNRQEEVRDLLSDLQSALNLQNFPRRIECFDISNIQGRDAVGSLVCFVHGEPLKEGYRRFRIKTVTRIDDYAMMKEVLSRRLARVKGHEEKWQKPDMMLIDGGRGQLGIVLEAMKELDITGIDLASLAKAHGDETTDKAYIPGRKNPIRLKPRSGLLHLLMRIRDEAHRFAIAYHKKIRGKGFLP